LKNKTACGEKDCRVWIQYEEDNNCTLISVLKHGTLTLEETAKRLNCTAQRVKQLEDRALNKLITRKPAELKEFTDPSRAK